MGQIDRVLRSNLKLRHLQLLVALDEFRHLGKTADFLSVSPPAVSKTLAELEDAFQHKLFERSTRGIRPSPYGETMVRFARTVLANYERAKDEVAAMAKGAAGRIGVGAMVVAMPVLLARSVSALKTRSPETTVLVEEGDLASLLPKLRIGELDLVLGRLEPSYAAPDLETEILYNEPMAIVSRPDHPLTGRRNISWQELASQPWVAPPPWASARRELEQTFLRHGLEPARDLIESASFLATLSSLRERPAVAFFARSVALHFERLGLLTVLSVDFPHVTPPVGIVRFRGRRHAPSAELLIECLRSEARSIKRSSIAKPEKEGR